MILRMTSRLRGMAPNSEDFWAGWDLWKGQAGIPTSAVKPTLEGVGEIPHLELDSGPDIVVGAGLALGEPLQARPNIGRPLLQFCQVAGGLDLFDRRTRGQGLLLSADLRTETAEFS